MTVSCGSQRLYTVFLLPFLTLLAGLDLLHFSFPLF